MVFPLTGEYHYDPGTAQFLTRDPLVALTRSPYAYLSDNPLNGDDPSGLDGNFPVPETAPSQRPSYGVRS